MKNYLSFLTIGVLIFFTFFLPSRAHALGPSLFQVTSPTDRNSVTQIAVTELPDVTTKYQLIIDGNTSSLLTISTVQGQKCSTPTWGSGNNWVKGTTDTGNLWCTDLQPPGKPLIHYYFLGLKMSSLSKKKFSWTIKANNGITPVLTTINLPRPEAPPVTLTLDKSNVASGAKVRLSAENIQKNTPYVISITDTRLPGNGANGLPGYHNIKINPTDICVKGSPEGGVFTNSNEPWCYPIGDTFTYEFEVNTAGLTCADNTCIFNANFNDKDNGNTFPLLGSSSITITPPSGITLKANGAAYEDSESNFSVTGCKANEENIKFIWWKDAEIPTSCIEAANDTCEAHGNSDNEADGSTPNPATADANGTATIKKFFQNSGSYAMQVSCNGQFAFTEFQVNGVGDNAAKIEILNPPITLDTPFQLEVSSLKPDECYYVRIQDPNGNFNNTLNPILEVDNNMCPGLSDKPYFMASNQWGPISTLDVPRLGRGVYTFYLMDNVKGSKLKSISRAAAIPIGIGIGVGLSATGVGVVIAAPAGAAGAYIYKNIAGAYNSSKDQILDTKTICIGEEDATIEDCTRLPDPPLPPCKQGYIGDKSNIVDAPVLPKNATAEQAKEYKDKLKEFSEQIDGCLVVDTAFGSISTDPPAFIRSIMALLLSLSGGIALILIILSGYKLMSSRGDPEKIQAAKDRLTSAIIGLLFIIFSLVIVQVIGVDILRIPGFGQ